MNAPMVVDYKSDGKDVKGLLKPARNGYLYWLSRSDRRRHRLRQRHQLRQAGRVQEHRCEDRAPDLQREPGARDRQEADFCPSLWGGKDWPFEAYNPKTGMVYIPANENHCGYLEGKEQEYVAGKWWTGVDIPDIGFTVTRTRPSSVTCRRGTSTAARRCGTIRSRTMMWGSVLATGGGLVFVGGTNDRKFRAFDAKSGQVLWQITTNSGIMAPPVVVHGRRQAVHRRGVRVGR